MKNTQITLSGKKWILFTLFLTLVLIFLTDTYQLHNVDAERERILRLILGIVSPLVVFIATYTSFLRFRGKINKLQFAVTNAILFSGLLPITLSYTNYSGFILTLYFLTRNLLIGILFAIVYDWFKKVINEKEAQKQQLNSELASLKYQVNPHFLFNTLNNIDSLIKNEPDKASETVIKLSDIMRYMLYNTRSETVLLADELIYIESFIELQKMQHANPNFVKYEVDGEPQNLRVAPMLFIPYVENAFKHCTDKEVDDAILLKFSVTSEKIIFEAKNIFNKYNQIHKDKASGIGLRNVKRRLDLLYHNKYSLTIDERNNLYSVKLIIMLV